MLVCHKARRVLVRGCRPGSQSYLDYSYMRPAGGAVSVSLVPLSLFQVRKLCVKIVFETVAIRKKEEAALL